MKNLFSKLCAKFKEKKSIVLKKGFLCTVTIFTSICALLVLSHIIIFNIYDEDVPNAEEYSSVSDSSVINEMSVSKNDSVTYYDKSNESDEIDEYDIKDQDESMSISPQLHIEGTQIYDSNNNVVRLRGLSTLSTTYIYKNWSGADWSTWYNEESLETVKNWGVNIIRFGVKPEQVTSDKTVIIELEKYIDLCTSKGIYADISWQYGDNPNLVLGAASAFFDEITKKYADNPYVIYEICNEPFNSSWSDIYSYATQLITNMRTNDSDAIILVGMPYEGIGGVEDNVLSVIGNELPYDNIMYTHHIYVGQSLDSNRLNNLVTLLDHGIPVFISEWGTTMSNGTDGFYETFSNIFMEFMDQHNLSWINYNFSDIQFRLADNIPYDSSIVLHGKWSNQLDDNVLSQSGFYVKHILLGDCYSYNNLYACMMMNYQENYAFWDPAISSKIISLEFLNSDVSIDNVIDQWDVSMVKGSNDVIAYITSDESGDFYKLYIKPRDGEVIAPTKINSYFSNFTNLRTVSFNNFNTFNTVQMRSLFRGCKQLEEIDLSELDLTNVNDMSCIFEQCISIKNISFDGCNLTQVTGFPYSFYNTKSLEVLDIGNIDINILKSCKSMFKSTQDDLTVYVEDSKVGDYIRDVGEQCGKEINIVVE